MKSTRYVWAMYAALMVCVSTLFISCPGTETGIAQPITEDDPDRVLRSIALTGKPVKVEYEVGDTLDTTGLEVTATYNDKSDSVIDISKCDIGVISGDTGSQTITVSYRKGEITKTAEFDIWVSAKGITFNDIVLTQGPDKTAYENAEKLDTAGMRITAKYSGGADRDVTDSVSVTGFVRLKRGKQTITVSYSGKAVTFEINLTAEPSYKVNSKDQRVIHTMWGEPEEDPRQVIGYQLADSGQKYFDHYVMLYGLRLRDNDCVANPSRDSSECQLSGLHLCIDNRIRREYFGNYNKYLKPVRDAGIKVVLSIVPDHSGVCVGTLYRWPMEEWYKWTDIYPNETKYRYDETAVAAVITQLRELYRTYPFDGIGYDEEYGNLDGHTNERGRGTVYPEADVYTNINTTTAKRIGGENILRFIHEVNEALGDDLIHETYEWRYGQNIPENYTCPDGTVITRDDLLDYSFNANYGGFSRNSANDMPPSKFGPMAISICDTVGNGGPRPPRGETLSGYLEDHLRYNYGVFMYYCLRSRDEITRKFPGYFGSGSPNPEIYFSAISRYIHGEATVYEGPDYARVW